MIKGEEGERDAYLGIIHRLMEREKKRNKRKTKRKERERERERERKGGSARDGERNAANADRRSERARR